MNATKSTRRRVAAGLGALALGLASIIGGSTAAFAAPGPDQDGAPKMGSLTIHKYVGAEGPAGDGTQITETSALGDPLEGAEFTIWRLGKENASGTCQALDLGTYDGWADIPTEGAPRTTAGVEAAGFCLADSGVPQTTEGDGETKFTDLSLGLYYVQETAAPANITSRTAPFYVSIPLPHEKQNWIYDVHAYPKNQKADAPTKTINTDAEQPTNGLIVGSVVEWTITQKVPTLAAGDAYTSASVWDYLPAGLKYDATTSVNLDDALLEEGADYTIDTGGVTWELTETGLAKLTAGAELKVVFTTTVTEVTETGDIANPGNTDPGKPGYGSEFNGGMTPGDPTPHSYWGQLDVTKVDQDDVALKGAEFKVFDNFAGEACPAEPPAADTAIATGVSDTAGKVQWADVTPTSPLGLFIANSENGPITDPVKTYCLYETKVPAGYSADPAGKSIEIKPGTTNNIQKVTIKNTKKDGPDLPLTGAQGTALLTAVGLLLVAGGAGAVAVSRRKNS